MSKYRIFSKEIEDFIRENALGMPNLEMTNLVNLRFNSNYSVEQISRFKKNKNIKSGLTGRFEKGNISHNKGKKMPKEIYKKVKATMFKKGNTPHNHRPVGSERVDSKDGFRYIKIAEPRTWALKHVHLWEQHYGKVPKSHKVIFRDGDRENIVIENLKLVSTAEWCEFTCRLKVSNKNPEITDAGLNVAKLKCAIRKRVKNALQTQ